MRLLYNILFVFCAVLGTWCLTTDKPDIALVLWIISVLTGFAARYMLKMEMRVAKYQDEHETLVRGLQDFRDLINLSQTGGVTTILDHGRPATWERLLSPSVPGVVDYDQLASNVQKFDNVLPAFELIGRPLSFETQGKKKPDLWPGDKKNVA